MFEDRTYETLMKEALSIITSDIDKQEGSLIMTALSPCIYKLAETYVQLDALIDLVSGDTATGEYLDRVVSDYGITRKSPTYAYRKVITSGEVEISKRWSLNETTYEIIELLSTNVYKAKCEQLGSIGNIYSGILEPIDFVNGVTATLSEIITSGEDTETDDNLRLRFYNKVRTPGTSGNADHYKQWALEVSGCGDAKVFPLANGHGTVKILVVDENMEIDTNLPATVAQYVETVRPIGATVTVESPGSKAINITANIRLDGSEILANVKEAFTTTVTSYLKETVFDIYSVSYAKIGSILLSTSGVQDYDSLLVNAGTANITIADSEMAMIGTITLSEVTQ